MNKLIYVSALLDLNEDRSKYRTFEKSFDLFKPILNSSIKMICFVSKNIKEKITSTNNIEFINIELEDLDTYKLVKKFNVSLPLERNDIKDTLNFLILMNSKTEFIKKAMSIVNFTHYAWIDFNICHVFKDITNSIKYLENLQKFSYNLEQNILAFPGCWPKGYKIDNSIYDQINWRFCGGFFIGDKKSLENFVNIFDQYFVKILSSGKIMWETNVWAYIEFFTLLNIQWFKGDHDDSIIRFKDITFFN